MPRIGLSHSEKRRHTGRAAELPSAQTEVVLQWHSQDGSHRSSGLTGRKSDRQGEEPDPGAVRGAPAELVKSAAFMSGLGDVGPVRPSFRNEKLGLTSRVVAEVSVLQRGAIARCPLLVAFGGNEPEDFQLQSRDVASVDWKRRVNAPQVSVNGY